MKIFACNLIIAVGILILGVGLAIWSFGDKCKYSRRRRMKHPINSPSDTYHIL